MPALGLIAKSPEAKKWDFDLAAQHLEMYGGVAHLSDALLAADIFSLAGGLISVQTSKPGSLNTSGDLHWPAGTEPWRV